MRRGGALLALLLAALACTASSCSAMQPPRRLLLLQQQQQQQQQPAAKAQPRARERELITVPIAVTVVEPAAGTPRPYDRIAEAGIAQHIAQLNALFAGAAGGNSSASGGAGPFNTRFRFRVCRLRYVEDDAWYRTPLFSHAEVEARVASRVGGAATLNLFIKPLVNTSAEHGSSDASRGSSSGPSVNGHSTFPWSGQRVRGAGHSAGAHGDHGGEQLQHPMLHTASYDGVVIDGFVVPEATRHGGQRLPPELATSSVLAHEVGHHLGLLHTFEGTARSAAPTDGGGGGATCTEGPGLLLADGSEVLGDGCDDTPAHLPPSNDFREWSCDAGRPRDSCANLPGPDPNSNVMNYVLDGCRQGFTACQDGRMAAAWAQWRAPGAIRPIARRDVFADLPHSKPSVLPVFANDASAIPGNPFILASDDDVAWSVPKPPAHGTLSRTRRGDALVYTPRPGTAPGTTDSFRYRVFDCHGESKLATVRLQLAAAAPQAARESESASSTVRQILLQNLKPER